MRAAAHESQQMKHGIGIEIVLKTKVEGENDIEMVRALPAHTRSRVDRPANIGAKDRDLSRKCRGLMKREGFVVHP